MLFRSLDQILKNTNQASGEDSLALFPSLNGDIRVLEDCQKTRNSEHGDQRHGINFVFHQGAVGPYAVIEYVN